MPGAVVTSGERVTLRTVEREDVPFLQRAYANPEIRYPIGNPLRNREQIDVPEDDDASDQFLVCLDGDSEARTASDRATGPSLRTDDAGPGQPEDDARRGQPDGDGARRLGAVYVGDADWRRPGLVYWLVPEVHREGYGTEAVSLAIDYVFRVYDHPAVGARAFDFNDASRGLLESLGFTQEGRIRKDRFVDGEYRDMVQYGLLRREWRGRDRT